MFRTTRAAKDRMLEQAIIAALGSHNLEAFVLVGNGGYQARCKHCGMTAWVGKLGIFYSLLADECPNKFPI